MERRKHARHPTCRPAKASFGGQGAMPCWIRDMSPDGARIEISGAGWISYAFNLRDVMSGALRKCAVVWRNNTPHRGAVRRPEGLAQTGAASPLRDGPLRAAQKLR